MTGRTRHEAIVDAIEEFIVAVIRDEARGSDMTDLQIRHSTRTALIEALEDTR